MTFIMLEGCLRQMTFILPRLGKYGVSIIHINSSTIAISIVEPQDDADTFINSCGETGERPAIRVMIIINDVLVTYNHTEDINKTVQLNISYINDSDNNSLNIYNILLAIIKPKLDGVKANFAANVLLGLNRFVADNGLRANAYGDVINAVINCAKEEGLNLTEYLVKYANE